MKSIIKNISNYIFDNKNNNNNNNFSKLPTYIQNSIVFKLCRFINYYSKNKNKFNGLEYFEINIELNQLILKLSLVCKDWFQIVSNNINVYKINYKLLNTAISNDNIVNIDIEPSPTKITNDYSIIKLSNCKYLKCESMDQLISFLSKINLTLKINDKNELMILKSSPSSSSSSSSSDSDSDSEGMIIIKKIIITTTNKDKELSSSLCFNRSTHVNIPNYENDPLIGGFINKINLKEFSQLRIIDDPSQTLKVSKIYTINIYYCENNNENKIEILNFFNKWSHSIKNITFLKISSKSFLYLLSGVNDNGINDNTFNNGINYLSIIESLITVGILDLTLEDIALILSSSNRLKEVSVNFCFKNLMYFLSNDQEKLKYSLSPCINCINNQRYKTLINIDYSQMSNNINEYEKLVKINWKIVSELFSNNNSRLQHLIINQFCNSVLQDKGDFEWPSNIDNSNLNSFSFFKEITNLVVSIKSLKKFTLKSSNTPQIFKNIIKRNQNIIHFHSIVFNTNWVYLGYYSERFIFYNLIKKYPHIKSFKFDNFNYYSSWGGYKKQNMITYIK
ncbi:hypothetical protein ACTFIT_003846 [Dictyostelium discoideum]